MKKIIFYTLLMGIITFAGLFTLHFLIREYYPVSSFRKTAVKNKENAGIIRKTSVNSFSLKIARENNPLSLGILGFVFVLQFFAALSAGYVINSIKRKDFSSDIKLKQLQNADIFLDVPLYIGLLGTVLSFVIIIFTPDMGRLIAYSSTIIGIIISLILRLSLLFPYKQKLLEEVSSK